MLMRFNVKNFLSFNEMTEFTMFSGKQRLKKEHLIENPKVTLLKFTALYGANASGKSNLIKAIDCSKNIIIYGVEKAPQNSYYKGNLKNKNIYTTFEYEFLLNNKCYAYGFNIYLNKKEIAGEWLYDISSSSNEKLIFERNLVENSFKYGIRFKNPENNTRFKIYSEDVKSDKNTLFLSELNRNKSNLYKKNEEFYIFKDIYYWFLNTLDINFASAPITDFEYMMGNNKDYNSKITSILDMFGTSIVDFNLVDSNYQDIKKDIPKEVLEDIENKFISHKKLSSVHLRGMKNFYNITMDNDNKLKIKTLAFKHENQDCNFYLNEESDGTRRLMDLIEILLNCENKIYIIDEIDRSLHPNLTYKFLEIFLEFAKDRNVQLIVTTHEDRILDLDILRRDEVWFVSKDKFGCTDLYSLEDFGDRFDKKIIKSYLEGRYGAIPEFKELTLNKLVETIRGSY